MHTYNKLFFYCEKCENRWESTPEAERDYLDYAHLRDRTTLIVRDLKQDGSFGPAEHIDLGELMRRHELAKKIVTEYRHLLDLDPGEWHDIKQDAQD